MFKKIVNPFFLLTLIFLICTISKVDAQGGQTVSIPDTDLAFWIRVHLDLPTHADITAADMLKLTKLQGSGNEGISDLTGLEHATINFFNLHKELSEIVGYILLFFLSISRISQISRILRHPPAKPSLIYQG